MQQPSGGGGQVTVPQVVSGPWLIPSFSWHSNGRISEHEPSGVQQASGCGQQVSTSPQTPPAKETALAIAVANDAAADAAWADAAAALAAEASDSAA